MKFQITLFCQTGQYKPISTTVDAPTVEEFKSNLKYYKKLALQKICGQRYRDGSSLLRSGYTLMKWRIYDKDERKAYAVSKLTSMMK